MKAHTFTTVYCTMYRCQLLLLTIQTSLQLTTTNAGQNCCTR